MGSYRNVIYASQIATWAAIGMLSIKEGKKVNSNDQEPPRGESTTTECGFNYQLLTVIYRSSPMGSS